MVGEGLGGSRVSPARGSELLGALVRGWQGKRGLCGSCPLAFQLRGWRAGASSEAWFQPHLHLVPQARPFPASQSPACGSSGSEGSPP